MNITDFVKYIELYYGEYKNEWVKDSLIKYLQKEWIYESEIEKLYKALIRYYSSSYDKNGAPDIAIIEKVDKEYRIRQWAAGGDRIIPPGEKKVQKLPEEEDFDREDFCNELREQWRRMQEKIDECMKQIRKEGNGK